MLPRRNFLFLGSFLFYLKVPTCYIHDPDSKCCFFLLNGFIEANLRGAKVALWCECHRSPRSLRWCEWGLICISFLSHVNWDWEERNCKTNKMMRASCISAKLHDLSKQVITTFQAISQTFHSSLCKHPNKTFYCIVTMTMMRIVMVVMHWMKMSRNFKPTN